jgi:hypothetical protein
MNTSALDKIHARYNPEHDLGPDAPVHWSVEELAHLVGRLVKKVEALEAEIENMNTRFAPANYDDASDR